MYLFMFFVWCVFFFFFKQKTAYEMRISDWSSDVCSSDLVGAGGSFWFPPAPAANAAPGQGAPFWIQRQLSSWSLGSWLYLREGSGNASGTIGGASQLGGSQAGLRLAYGFGETGRVRAYGRATMALGRPRQRELAFGLAFAPRSEEHTSGLQSLMRNSDAGFC